MKLTDQTKVGNATWSQLKEKAMQEDYAKQTWFISLTPEERQVVLALRVA